MTDLAQGNLINDFMVLFINNSHIASDDCAAEMRGKASDVYKNQIKKCLSKTLYTPSFIKFDLLMVEFEIRIDVLTFPRLAQWGLEANRCLNSNEFT